MNCLICYKPLTSSETDYHPSCVMKVFSLKQMPVIDIDDKKLISYAKEIVGGHNAITGVQPKLSIWLEESKKNIRFTVIDGKSNYIIKPQSETYISLPENEDLCMHLAEAFGIHAAKHSLVRLPSGNLAYITQRFERIGEKKLACEDLCQLTETLTEHKDRGSYEKAGKAIKQYSTQPGLDVISFFELVLVSFITANADMHLKNFSMLEMEDGQFVLSPAYDLVSTALVIKNEEEQMMLSLNGKRNKITKKDFIILANNLQLTEKQQENIFRIFLEKEQDALWWIENSFLPNDHKDKLKNILSTRLKLFNS
jgi:serine/threonine-protein kinase HipA